MFCKQLHETVNIKQRYYYFFISLIVVLLDQFSKNSIQNSMQLHQLKYFTPWWDWVLVYNNGAAFNMFAGNYMSNVFLSLFSIVAVIAICFYILTNSCNKLTTICLSLILGGAVGNLIDRMSHGQVTDFIYWHIQQYYWPAFNIADSCITIGVVLLAIDNICCNKKNQICNTKTIESDEQSKS